MDDNSDLKQHCEKMGKPGEWYYSYKCRRCGKDATNRCAEPYGSRMLEARMCFECDYWDNFEKYEKPVTIINHHVYSPGNRTSGDFRGMGGRRFDIEYLENSKHAGKRITTFDLWSGSTIPEKLWVKFPDTARFLGDATRAQVGEITCWNPSDGKSEPYPLPCQAGI